MRHRRRWWTRRVPVTVRYGTAAAIGTFIEIRKYGPQPFDWYVEARVKCGSDDDWQTIVGDVTSEYDRHNRIVRLDIFFDIPCDTAELGGSGVFGLPNLN